MWDGTAVYGRRGPRYVARMRPLLCFLLVLLWLPVSADVYRWTDDKGVVHYTDKPPAGNAKPVELPKLQTYKPGATPAPSATPDDDAAAAPVAASSIAIVTPQPEETIRDSEGKVSVVVNAAVETGQGLVYYLDGKAQNEPTPSTGYLLLGVERGEHQISAALVAADGRELARAGPVKFYRQQVSKRP